MQYRCFCKAAVSLREIFSLVILVLIQAGLIIWYIGKFDELPAWSKETIKAGYFPSERVLSKLSPYGPGFERELLDLFHQEQGLKAELVELKDYEQALDDLKQGRLQLLLIGPPHKPPEDKGLVKGHPYLESSLLVVHNHLRYPLNTLSDLCSSDLAVIDGTVFSIKLETLSKELQCAIKPAKKTDNGWSFFETLSERSFRFGMVDELTYRIWKGFYPQVHKTHLFQPAFEHVWLWSRNYQDIHEQLAAFWKLLKKSGELEELYEKYFGFFPENQDPYQLRHFQRVLQDEVPEYAQTILDASRKYSIDPLFLVALIYQESHFDSHAVSRTGVQGLLQITSQTAEFLGMENRLDPHESILGGARYLSMLAHGMEDIGIESWDKWFLALAAYNQGLGHVYDARALAQRKEKNPDAWSVLKQIYPLLSNEKYYQDMPRGYARGFEAVRFVENVRYYYYLAYGMISLSRPETEHLGGFLDFVPPDWPE